KQQLGAAADDPARLAVDVGVAERERADRAVAARLALGIEEVRRRRVEGVGIDRRAGCNRRRRQGEERQSHRGSPQTTRETHDGTPPAANAASSWAAAG